MDKYIELYEGALKEAEYWKNRAAKMNGNVVESRNAVAKENGVLNTQISQKDVTIAKYRDGYSNLYNQHQDYQRKTHNAYVNMGEYCQEKFRTYFG